MAILRESHAGSLTARQESTYAEFPRQQRDGSINVTDLIDADVGYESNTPF
jgi:hypothetical protein